jgi:hypothetical protein
VKPPRIHPPDGHGVAVASLLAVREKGTLHRAAGVVAALSYSFAQSSRLVTCLCRDHSTEHAWVVRHNPILSARKAQAFSVFNGTE